MTTYNKILQKENGEVVIQSNMLPQAIVEVWEVTADIFDKYRIPIINQSLENLVEHLHLATLVPELNSSVGSSTATCIEGGLTNANKKGVGYTLSINLLLNKQVR
jgi:hypothetical protein